MLYNYNNLTKYYLFLKNYLRVQSNSAESYDLISETASYLEALEREIDPTNILTAFTPATD